MAITADANPPSTSAPSPPITTRPMRAGSATQSAVRIKGDERCRVFWSENDVPKPPRSTSSKNSTGDFPSASKSNENNTAVIPSANSGMTTYSAPRRRRIERSPKWLEAITAGGSGSAMSAMLCYQLPNFWIEVAEMRSGRMRRTLCAPVPPCPSHMRGMARRVRQMAIR